MSRILIPNNLIITKNSTSALNKNISEAEYLKYSKAFSNPENEYIFTISPKVNRKITHSVLLENSFSAINPCGDFTLNIFNIQNFLINFKSNKLKIVDEYHQLYKNPYDDQIDFLSCKNWTINANNIELNIDIEHSEGCNQNEITFYKRDLLPLESLIINSNQARVCIQNQDIKKLYINVQDPHDFTLILKNLFKLEYLDISNIKRLDLENYGHPYLHSAFGPYSRSFHYHFSPFNEVEECPINYFNLECINGDCLIKLNSDLCFYFQSEEFIKKSTVMLSIPILSNEYNNNYNNDCWYRFYLSQLFNCRNKKYIEVKWKDLQKKIILKTNEILKEKILKDIENINKELENCIYPTIKKEG